MATLTALKPIPHTRIENVIIDDYLPQIGVYGFTVYTVLKRHQNQKTGRCDPSYATIARKIGIDRGTVIRYVKKLKALELISPNLRFKEDGLPTSNQYNFPNRNSQEKPDDQAGGSCTEPPPLVAENNQASCQAPPEQISENKTDRKSEQAPAHIENQDEGHPELQPVLPHRQQTCSHPHQEIVVLTDGIVLCNHCYGLVGYATDRGDHPHSRAA